MVSTPPVVFSCTPTGYVRGFICFLAGFSDAELCRAIADFGLCLRKIPNIGPLSARVGFSCNILAQMPGMEPVSQPAACASKSNMRQDWKLIEKLNGAAERAGL